MEEEYISDIAREIQREIFLLVDDVVSRITLGLTSKKIRKILIEENLLPILKAHQIMRHCIINNY